MKKYFFYCNSFFEHVGTAKLCSFLYKKNIISIYKILLINATELINNKIYYNQHLKKWEDVSLTSRVLTETKLQTLKVATFSYFAFSSSKGGCATERNGNARVVRTMADVVENGLGVESGRKMLEWEEKDAKRIVAWARKSLVVRNGSSGGEVVDGGEGGEGGEQEVGEVGEVGEEGSNLNGNGKEYVDKGEKYREESVEPKFLNGDLEELF